jgi:hypothetical protein
MLEKFSYVFIIGAGGSYPYNFPLGQGLYDDIRDKFASRVNHYYHDKGNIFADEMDIIKTTEDFCSELN